MNDCTGCKWLAQCDTSVFGTICNFCCRIRKDNYEPVPVTGQSLLESGSSLLSAVEKIWKNSAPSTCEHEFGLGIPGIVRVCRNCQYVEGIGEGK